MASSYSRISQKIIFSSSCQPARHELFWLAYMVAMTITAYPMFALWTASMEVPLYHFPVHLVYSYVILQAQLHPHFLFNTLNNLYTLVLEKSDRAPQMLLQLSELLSYVLYECKADEVPLDKEIMLISDYVSLERARYGDRLDISMDF